MASTKFTDGIKAAMVDTGRVGEKWRVEITGCERVGNNSDYARVYVNVYKPRSRKPDIMWDICVDIVKDLIYWDHSTYCNLK